MKSLHVAVSTVLLTTALTVAIALPASAGSLRSLEYSVDSNLAGPAARATVRLDLTAVGARHELSVELSEGAQLDAQTIRADLDRNGGVNSASSLRCDQEAMLYFFALSSQNMTGLERGDRWTHESPTPGGRQITDYAVTRNSGLQLEISIVRTLVLAGGSTERWRGRMLYDAAGAMPTLIDLQEVGATAIATPHFTIRLAKDSFKP